MKWKLFSLPGTMLNENLLFFLCIVILQTLRE